MPTVMRLNYVIQIYYDNMLLVRKLVRIKNYYILNGILFGNILIRMAALEWGQDGFSPFAK